MEAARQCGLVHIQMIEFHAAIFTWPSVIRTDLPRAGGLSLGEGRDVVT